MFQSIARKASALILIVISGYANSYTLEPFQAKDAPIIDFIGWFSEHTNTSVIVGEGVTGTVTLNINGLDSSEIIPFVTHVLNAHDFDLVKRDNLYVIESKDASSAHGEYSESVDSETEIFQLVNLQNVRLVDALRSLIQAENEAGEVSKPTQVKVYAIPATNKLAVTGSARQIETARKLIQDLDAKQSQVIIEAVIVESELSDSTDAGVNLSTALKANGFNILTTTLGTVANAAGLGNGGQVVYANDGNFQGLISALATQDRAKILSTPMILVTNNEQGRISVGQNVPFLVSKEVTDGGNTIQQIERRDVGVSLSVRPFVLGDGRAMLNILQESSSVTSSSIAADLITNKREISTVAEVHTGQTIVLGGLVSEEERKSQTGVPLLKSIPLIGRLFRRDTTQSVQRELTVLIKTTIL